MLTFDQLRRSWYIFFFQNALADLAVGHGRPRVHRPAVEGLVAGLRRAPPTSTTSATAIGDPEHLAAAVGYYRAMLQPDLQRPELGRPAGGVPTSPTPSRRSTCTGADDGCVSAAVADGALAYLPRPGSRVEVVAGAGHFLQLEQPEVVNRLVVEHLT